MSVSHVLTPVDGSSSALDAAYELARRLSEAGVRRMSGEILYFNLLFSLIFVCVPVLIFL